MLVDLNIPYPQKDLNSKSPSEADLKNLENTLTILHELGYTHIALNITHPHHLPFPKDINKMNPMNINKRFKKFMEITGIKLYSRLTILINDPSKGQSLAKITPHYDIISALPISEKAVLVATQHLEIDILTFDYSNKLPMILKHKNICSCIKRGIKIEINYSNAIKDINSRRFFIQNLRNVIRSSRNRGIIISSGAQSPLECRNVLAINGLLKMCGLKKPATELMGNECGSILLQGRLRRKSYKQVIAVGDINVVENVTEDGSDNDNFTKLKKRRLE